MTSCFAFRFFIADLIPFPLRLDFLGSRRENTRMNSHQRKKMREEGSDLICNVQRKVHMSISRWLDQKHLAHQIRHRGQGIKHRDMLFGVLN
jgi:hypothetical protein